MVESELRLTVAAAQKAEEAHAQEMAKVRPCSRGHAAGEGVKRGFEAMQQGPCSRGGCEERV